MKNINLYNHWIKHDLTCDLPLFQNLPEHSRTEYWEKIEDLYFHKYDKFLRIEFEWGLSGVWAIPFPGSLNTGPNTYVEYYGIPSFIGDAIQKWVDHLDLNFEPWNGDELTDQEWKDYHKWGLSVTLELGKYIPPNCYLEFSKLKQIVKSNGGSKELDIDEQIKRILILDT